MPLALALALARTLGRIGYRSGIATGPGLGLALGRALAKALPLALVDLARALALNNTRLLSSQSCPLAADRLSKDAWHSSKSSLLKLIALHMAL